jgi:hypothetical protein
VVPIGGLRHDLPPSNKEPVAPSPMLTARPSESQGLHEKLGEMAEATPVPVQQ